MRYHLLTCLSSESNPMIRLRSMNCRVTNGKCVDGKLRWACAKTTALLI